MDHHLSAAAFYGAIQNLYYVIVLWHFIWNGRCIQTRGISAFYYGGLSREGDVEFSRKVTVWYSELFYSCFTLINNKDVMINSVILCFCEKTRKIFTIFRKDEEVDG